MMAVFVCKKKKEALSKALCKIKKKEKKLDPNGETDLGDLDLGVTVVDIAINPVNRPRFPSSSALMKLPLGPWRTSPELRWTRRGGNPQDVGFS